MRDGLQTRTRCMDEIRAVAHGNEFLTLYALLYALECLDLDELNRVTDALVETAALGIDVTMYAQLRRERFGR